MATFKVLDFVTKDYQRDTNGNPRLVTVGSPAYVDLLRLGFEPTAFGLMVPRFVSVPQQDIRQPTEGEIEAAFYEFGLLAPIVHAPDANTDVWRIMTPKPITNAMVTEFVGVHPRKIFSIFVERHFDEPGDNIAPGAYGEITFEDLTRFTPTKVGRTSYSAKNVRKFYNAAILNNYGKGRVYLVLYNNNQEPRPFALFVNDEVNCALALIGAHPRCTRRKAFNKLSEEVLAEGNGFTPAHADAVQKCLLLRVVVKNQIDTWYDSDPGDKHKRPVVTIFGNENHATEYKKLTQPKKVIYTSEEEMKQIEAWIPGNKEVFGRHVKTKKGISFVPNGYRTHDTVVKTYKPPVLENDPEYFTCMSDLSFEYKRWKLTNNIRPADPAYYELIRKADHHLTTQQFADITADTLYAYDQNKAFPSFKKSPYYAQYKLPLGGYRAYFVEDDKSVLDRTGFSIIYDIEYHSELVEKTGWIQNNCIYSNMRLKYILEKKLASFVVIATITAIGEDIDFPFKKTEFGEFEQVDDRERTDAKRFNNSFIGRLIMGGSSDQISHTYSSNFAHEREQIIFNAKTQPDYVSHTEEGAYITVVSRVEASQNNLHGIHAYILDYQQISFIDAMLKTELTNIVAFHTDGFFTYRPVDPVLLPHRTEPHLFKHYEGCIRFDSTYAHAPHTVIENTNFTDYSKHLHSQFNLIYGPPGCGKSKEYFVNPIYGAVMLTPTHLLKCNHQKRSQMFVQTLHSFFGIGTKNPFVATCDNVIIDEITMVPAHIVKRIVQTCKKHRINLDLVGDIDEKGIHQMRPPKKLGEPIQWREFSSFEKLRRVSTTRQNEEDTQFLNSLRGRPFRQQLRLLRNNPKVHFVTSADEYDFESTGVISTHERAQVLNTQMEMRLGQQFLRLRAVKKGIRRTLLANTPYVNGQIMDIVGDDEDIWRDRISSEDTAPKGTKFELGYFNTADAVQGQTVEGKLFIDLVNADRDNYLYVAVTRCTDLANVFFIEEPERAELPAEAIAEIKQTYEPIEIMEEEAQPIAVPTQLTETKVIPREYIRKVDYEKANEEGFIINCELPYRKFLAFDSHMAFADWEAAQPMHMRSYHEVNNTPMRRLMVDIDGANVPRAEWAQFGNECVGKFVAVFNKYYADKAIILPTDVNDELAIINASGYSAQKKADKFSLQIRTVSYVTNIYDAAKFASSFAQTLTRPETVDLGIYSPYRCMRIVGSTKKDDNRHSRCMSSVTLADTFLSANIDWCTRLSAEITTKPKATHADIPDEMVQKIVTRAESYTRGSNFHSCVGNELRYRRTEPSHCHCCGHVHDQENIVIKVKNNSLFLGCYRDKSLSVELEFDDLDIPDTLENVNAAHTDAGFTDV